MDLEHNWLKIMELLWEIDRHNYIASNENQSEKESGFDGLLKHVLGKILGYEIHWVLP